MGCTRLYEVQLPIVQLHPFVSGSETLAGGDLISLKLETSGKEFSNELRLLLR